MDILRGLLGIAVLTFLLYLLSEKKKSVNWQLVGVGLLLQIVLALLIIKVPGVKFFFEGIVNFFVLMIGSSEQAAKFLFGNLADKASPYGFAFYVLPTIVFFSALSSLLYYLGILQKIVFGFAWVMNRTMRISGAESLAAAANVFIGQTEAPLVVKPYLERMTRSEVLCLMCGGMATIAGGVFGAYMSMLGGSDPEGLRKFGMHLLTASVISAPAAIVAAKIILPEEDRSNITRSITIPKAEAGSNLLDAIVRGTSDGLKLAVNVGAMLLAFMAFIYLLNAIFLWLGGWTGLNDAINLWTNGAYKEFSMQFIFGILFSPIAWIIGVEPQDILAVGRLLGEKTVLNEFVAYVSLADLKNQSILGDKSIIIATYALCGFANFASIGIQIGGIGALVPGQRNNLLQLGFKSLIGGTIACLYTAAVAGMIV